MAKSSRVNSNSSPFQSSFSKMLTNNNFIVHVFFFSVKSDFYPQQNLS